MRFTKYIDIRPEKVDNHPELVDSLDKLSYHEKVDADNSRIH